MNRIKVFTFCILTLITILILDEKLYRYENKEQYNYKKAFHKNMQRDIDFYSENSNTGKLNFKCYRNQGKLYITYYNARNANIYINGNKVEIEDDILNGDTYIVDISAFTQNGENILNISDIDNGYINIKIPYPTVIEAESDFVGFDTEKLKTIDMIIEKEIEYGFSGCQLAIIKDGVIVKNSAYGYTNSYLKDGSKIQNPITTDIETLYDLASNTKMFATNYALQMLVAENKLNIDMKVNDILEGFVDNPNDKIKGKEKITVKMLLQHRAGFGTDPKYYSENCSMFSQKKSTTEDMILKTPISYEPDTDTVYTDLDYMLLGMIVEKISNMSLDRFVEQNIYRQLGFDKIVFNPLYKGFLKQNIAATELNGNSRDGTVSFLNNRDYTVQGEVHDEKAFYSMNGVSGHAGLFSNAEQLAKLAQMMLNGGGYGNIKLFDKSTVELFTANSPALGWKNQKYDNYQWAFGKYASDKTYGHTGWTGTLSLIDPQNELIIVLLTNKKNSVVINPKLNPNDFYGDHFLCGSYGDIASLIYECFDSTKDINISIYQIILDKISKLESYSQNLEVRDSLLALVDTFISKAETDRDISQIPKIEYILNKIGNFYDVESFYNRIAILNNYSN